MMAQELRRQNERQKYATDQRIMAAPEAISKLTEVANPAMLATRAMAMAHQT